MRKLFILLPFLLIIGCFGYGQVMQTGIPVHDPVMIKQDSLYFVFGTGKGLAMWSSADKVHWKKEGPIFETAPLWAKDIVTGFKNEEWAPDISYYSGLYYLYYAVSEFGKNNSAIGLATNTTLYTNNPAYKWIDRGIIIKSVPGKTNWNAIDPNLICDDDGVPYLVFGSFWEGIKIVRLAKDRLSADQQLTDLPTLASRLEGGKDISTAGACPLSAGTNAIEAPFIFKQDGYFYLFASIDYCCKGPQSTYKMIVGRSAKLLGPYRDSKDKLMGNGGGDILLTGDTNWYGVGHNAVCDFDGQVYLVFHGYDANDGGKSKLRIEKLSWLNGWPVVNKENKHN